MKRESIVLVGSGGHCKSVMDVIEAEGKYEVVGVIDNDPKIDVGVPILGNDDDLPEILKKYKKFLITVGAVKNGALRDKLYQNIKKHGGIFPVIISPNAVVSKLATIGEGTVVMHQALVNAGAIIGSNNIINSGAIVEHDVQIGDSNHISTSVTINGECSIGNICFIGSGTVVINNITIKDEVVIGAGSLLINNIEAPGVYVGSPIN